MIVCALFVLPDIVGRVWYCTRYNREIVPSDQKLDEQLDAYSTGSIQISAMTPIATATNYLTMRLFEWRTITQIWFKSILYERKPMRQQNISKNLTNGKHQPETIYRNRKLDILLKLQIVVWKFDDFTETGEFWSRPHTHSKRTCFWILWFLETSQRQMIREEMAKKGSPVMSSSRTETMRFDWRPLKWTRIYPMKLINRTDSEKEK